MNKFRKGLAQVLRQNIKERPHDLEVNGWKPKFIRESMPDIAYSSVMTGVRDSGDAVRIVTDAILLSWNGTAEALDETTFWRAQLKSSSSDDAPLTLQMLIALTKCFVLEWSIEFDYQIYHDLPTELLFG